MGQYYKGVILSSSKKNVSNKDKVVAYIESWSFDNGAKLMEHSYIGNDMVGAMEALINKENGHFAGFPIAWCGDYADEEPNTFKKEKINLYSLTKESGALKIEKANLHVKKNEIKVDGNMRYKHYRYIINEDTKEYVDTKYCLANKYKLRIHPLPLLVAEGNNRGGGDYYKENINFELVGIWARNVVVVSDTEPGEGYKRKNYYFSEGFE